MAAKAKSISMVNGYQEISHNCKYFSAPNEKKIVQNEPVLVVLVEIYSDYDPV